MNRRAELSERLERVRGRIHAAVAPQRAEPTLIVVTKFFPAADVELLRELGVRDVGENRDQEASAKAAELEQAGAAMPGSEQLHWHFIGQLQSNKAKSVVRYADAVHSVDRASLVKALDAAMAAEQQHRRESDLPQRNRLRCFIQIDLQSSTGAIEAVEGARPDQPNTTRGGPARGGADPDEVADLAGKIDAAEHLDLAGVMAVAPLGADPDTAFESLAGMSRALRRIYPSASAISAGMSADLEAALRHGATHLRVGSDVLGPRPTVR